jgi:hypothetical protein
MLRLTESRVPPSSDFAQFGECLAGPDPGADASGRASEMRRSHVLCGAAWRFICDQDRPFAAAANARVNDGGAASLDASPSNDA